MYTRHAQNLDNYSLFLRLRYSRGITRGNDFRAAVEKIWGEGAVGRRGAEAIRKARWDAEHLNFKCGVPLHARAYASRRAARGRWTGRIAVIRRFPARSNRPQPSFLSRDFNPGMDGYSPVYLPDIRHFRT